jgi:hypothetical protein
LKLTPSAALTVTIYFPSPSQLNLKTNTIMKKTIYLLILASILVMPQMSQATLSPMYSPSGGIKGNGKIVKQERSVTGFHAIIVSGGIDVYVIPGSTEKAVVETDENIQTAIITNVSNGVLKIYSEKSISNSKKMNVYVHVKELDKVTASGGCDVFAETNLNFPSLSFNFSGGCDLNLNCTTKELKCTLTGGSDAHIKGSADKADLEASGGSDIKAAELMIGKCKVEASGGSDAYLNVTGELSVEASGSSDVTYSGNAKIIYKSVTGASDLIRK